MAFLLFAASPLPHLLPLSFPMINWIQTKLQRHNKPLLLLLLAIVIVAFVFTFGPSSGLGGFGVGRPEINYYGVDLNSERESRAASLKAQLAFQIEFGQQPRGGMLENFLYQRLALLHLADVVGIPSPTDSQLGTFIAEKPGFFGPEGRFSREAYDRLASRMAQVAVDNPNILTEVLREEWRIEQVRDIVGGPGYVQAFDVVQQLQQQQTEWDVVTATYPLESFNPDIEPTEEELRTFYEARSFQYEEEPKVRASYIAFRSGKILESGQVETDPGDAVLLPYFQRNIFRFRRPASVPGQAAETPTFEENRQEVLSLWRQEQARDLAVRQADDFVVRLFRQEVAQGSEAFDRILQEEELELRPLGTFAQGEPPPEAPFPGFDAGQLFDLPPERYYSDVIDGEDAAYVALREETIPARIPDFEEVREQVRTDWLAQERRRLFTERGEELRGKLQEAAQEGEEALTGAAESAGLETASFDGFSLAEPPPGLNRSLLAELPRMAEGDVSPMIFSGEAGRFLFVARKSVPEIDTDSEEYTERLDQYARLLSSAAIQGLSSDLIQQGFEQAGIDTDQALP